MRIADKKPVSDTEKEDVVRLYGEMRQSSAKLVSPDGSSTGLPPSLAEFLSKMLCVLGEARSLSIVQQDAQFTTAEAGRILGVSRQFLVGLLEQGAIPFHKVGAHRRILAGDLLAYKSKRDARRHEILDALTRAETEDGLYDLEVPAAVPSKR